VDIFLKNIMQPKSDNFNPWASVQNFVASKEPKRGGWAKDVEKYASASEVLKRNVIEECVKCGPQLRNYAASEPGPIRKTTLLNVDFCLSDALERSQLKLGTCAKFKREWFSTPYCLMDGDVKLAAALLDRCTSAVLGKQTKQHLIDQFVP
jgi:hypothetical protein